MEEIKTPLTKELREEYERLIGKDVLVVMDRPIGAPYPKNPSVIYPINYGFVPGLIGGDGEEQDVYILGEDKPLKKFQGKIIAVIHRFDDDECKWVAAAEGKSFSQAEIENAVRFQEQFHNSIVIV